MRWATAMAVLLIGAAAGAIGVSANASVVGRVGGVFAALAMVVVALAALRGARWAFGAAFLLAVCWLWASVALALQGEIAAPEALVWVAWAIVVMVAGVRGRAPQPAGPRFPPLQAPVGEDEERGQGLHP